MARFVINEWLWADLSGSNGERTRRQSVAFLEEFVGSAHQLIITLNTAFDRKAWALCASRDALVAKIGKMFVLQVRQDSNRCLILGPDAVVTLPDDLAASVNPDDHYLVRAQLSTLDAVLVTTDGPLHETLRQHGLACMTREEFLRTYFGIHE